MQLCRKAARAQMRDAAYEAGVQLRGAEQLQEGGLGIGARDHRGRGDTLARLELDAGRAICLDQDALHRRARPDLRAVRGRGARQRFAERTHAADRLR